MGLSYVRCAVLCCSVLNTAMGIYSETNDVFTIHNWEYLTEIFWDLSRYFLSFLGGFAGEVFTEI